MQEKEIRKEGERAGQEGERARQEGERTGGWRLREEVIVARNKGADQSLAFWTMMRMTKPMSAPMKMPAMILSLQLRQ